MILHKKEPGIPNLVYRYLVQYIAKPYIYIEQRNSVNEKQRICAIQRYGESWEVVAGTGEQEVDKLPPVYQSNPLLLIFKSVRLFYFNLKYRDSAQREGPS